MKILIHYCVQDDLFPPTRVLWRPVVSASEWLSGDSGSPAWVSLRPRDMTSVSSDHQPVTPRNSRMEAALKDILLSLIMFVVSSVKVSGSSGFTFHCKIYIS